MTWLVLASLALLVVALLLGRRARLSANALGVGGELVYWDTGARDELMVSEAHGLAGRPDYILKVGGDVVPVERKSRKVSGSGPYDGEVLQLASYCLLVEERNRQPVRYGQLQYSNRTINVPFDDALRRRLFAVLRAMREAEVAGDVPRSHNSAARCRGCGFRNACRDSLAP